ncbi:DNA-directed RNA polymerase III subunit RPC7 [Strix aluco]|uniref:DNA-directed RNA polymerase III subunit RPC7 n=1 Tax=Strix aluco TaxID=111821 RepID=UPI003DA4AE62
MAGRGRGGRGRAALTFNIEAVGFAKGAALPEDVLEPPAPYPSTDNKPVPLKTGEDEDYMLALKQELRGTTKTLPYFLTVEHHEVIERYSKRYQDSGKEHATWTPDWRILPRELKPKEKTKKAGAKPKKAKRSEPKSNLEVLKKIEELEGKDDEDEKSEGEKSEDEKDKTKEKEGEDDEEAEESEEHDEEEHEEENDYIASYFEDGDDFDAASDDNMDEATY